MSLVISMAMSQRIPSHWAAMSDSVCAVAARGAGGERVELHDVGPGREVRVAAVREHVPADLQPARRVGLDVVARRPG